jgi:phosphomannomutase
MIKFGTSGFRGIIGDNWTKANVQKIAFAFRAHVKDMLGIKTDGVGARKHLKIAVGYDNRFMGRRSAEWFCEAACCDYLHASVYEFPVPTPVIAQKAATTHAYGVMFTASHNPYYYNGIKVFLSGGKEADDGFFARITKYIDSSTTFPLAEFADIMDKGFAEKTTDTESYINKVIAGLDTKKIKESGIKVLFNPMHGSGAGVVKALFERLDIKYQIINETQDAYFGGMVPAPYEHNLKDQCRAVVKNKFTVGFALDGDGDRVTFIDADGKIYDCNYLLAVFYYYYIEIKKRKGTIAKNFLSSNLTAKLCRKYGYSVHETRVGFKFLGPVLENTDALLAGESSGIAFKDISLIKDGIFGAFTLIDVICAMKKGIGKIVEEIIDIVDFPTKFIENAYVFEERARAAVEQRLHSPKNVPEFKGKVVKVDRYPDGLKIHFEDDYWAAARTSGNEPVARLYAEMPTTAAAADVIKRLENAYNLHDRQQ